MSASPCAPRSAALVLVALLGCLTGGSPDRGLRLTAALQDLAREQFRFAADVRFRSDRFAVCDGISCASLVLLRERRTILLAEDAFESDTLLRASLLEIWERYGDARPRTARESARGALRVLQDGPRVGVNDVELLRRVHHSYRRLFSELAPGERDGLPDPDSLAFP